ncbi:hypothetical protein ACXZ66_06840 [Corynebacterium sp. S7]
MFNQPGVTIDATGINVVGKIGGLSITESLGLIRHLSIAVQDQLNRPWSEDDPSTILSRGER